MIDFNVVLLDLENSDIAAVRFEESKSKCSYLEGCWTPPTFFNRKLQV
jgi:hypothetical protein